MISLCEKRLNILDCNGHLLVTGGPGSGKTTIALLKAQKAGQNLQPGQEVLFLSFSRAAIRQILIRCRNILSGEQQQLICVQTYHSFCLEILQSYGHFLTGKQPAFLYPGEERIRKSRHKGEWAIEQRRLMVEEGIFCFDLFAASVANLLEKSEYLRRLLSSKYPLIIVDEFQDTDNDQWRMIKAISGEATIFCLADPDQRIFDYKDSVDAQRINQAVAVLQPALFDLSGDNHRSPSSGILDFANTILLNRAPFPETDNVMQVMYSGDEFESSVHASVISMFKKLNERGIKTPSLAVLARSNGLIYRLSSILRESHYYQGRFLPPVEHEVVWDTELAAAAAIIVGSIMEWHETWGYHGLVNTLNLIGNYFELKYADDPTKKAYNQARQFHQAAMAVAHGKRPRIGAGRELLSIFNTSIKFVGNPVADWRSARQLLEDLEELNDLLRQVRMMRLFRIADALGSELADLWMSQGNYVGATAMIKHTLEQERLTATHMDSEGCTLMTIHKSKGKEFDGVVLVEGMFSGLFFDTKRKKPPYQQCRQILRVGITRARTFVTIVRPVNAVPLVSR